MNREKFDLSEVSFPRNKWPKNLPDLSDDQKVVADEFMKKWHEVLPKRFGIIEKFNHGYPTRIIPKDRPFRTLELGAGIGGHIPYEDLGCQEYHCVELRENMASEISKRFPLVQAAVGDVQNRLAYSDNYFDRVIVIHVLEHLPNLPKAILEVERVLKPGGIFSVVLPCDPGFLYGIARKISAERLFTKTTGLPYGWFISREHINSPSEILAQLLSHFEELDRSYFPTGIPIADLNLCIGITVRKPGTQNS